MSGFTKGRKQAGAGFIAANTMTQLERRPL